MAFDMLPQQMLLRLRRKGIICNHKRLYRVYKLLRLNVRRRMKRRLPQRLREPLLVPDAPNHNWSMDFMSDCLVDRRKFRVLNIIDDYIRESLALKIDTSLPSVTRDQSVGTIAANSRQAFCYSC